MALSRFLEEINLALSDASCKYRNNTISQETWVNGTSTILSSHISKLQTHFSDQQTVNYIKTLLKLNGFQNLKSLQSILETTNNIIECFKNNKKMLEQYQITLCNLIQADHIPAYCDDKRIFKRSIINLLNEVLALLEQAKKCYSLQDIIRFNEKNTKEIKEQLAEINDLPHKFKKLDREHNEHKNSIHLEKPAFPISPNIKLDSNVTVNQSSPISPRHREAVAWEFEANISNANIQDLDKIEKEFFEKKYLFKASSYTKINTLLANKKKQAGSIEKLPTSIPSKKNNEFQTTNLSFAFIKQSFEKLSLRLTKSDSEIDLKVFSLKK